MAMTLYATNFYSNDGSNLLWRGCLESALTITITSSGADIVCGDKFTGAWAYNGSGTFLGLSTSSGASTPTYAAGDSFTTALSTLNLYAVAQGGGGGGSGTLDIKYKNNTIFTQAITGSISKTLKCNNNSMYGDVNIDVDIPVGTMGTVSASKSISGNTATITPSISAGTAGYNAMAAKSGTAVTVSASEITSGTLTLSANTSGTSCVNYATVKVLIPTYDGSVS